MAALMQEVFERVRAELEKRPSLPTGILYQMALQIEPSLGGDVQAFHARYVAPVQYELAVAKRQNERTRKSKRRHERRSTSPRRLPAAIQTEPSAPIIAPENSPAGVLPEKHERGESGNGMLRRQSLPLTREHIRSIFLQLAGDLAGAETRAELVQVMSRLDGYVAQVAERVR